MDEKQFEKILKENLTSMIEGPIPVEIDKCWERFEQKLQEKEKHKEKLGAKNKLVIALVASIVFSLIIIPALLPEQVTAFKNSVFRSIKEEEGQRIITDKINSEAIEGEYINLTFEKAQSLTVQHLLYPEYLPEKFKDTTPQIDVTINNHPYSLTAITFKINDDDFIILIQESLVGERENRTYVPQNVNVETVKLLNDDKEILLFKVSDTLYRINWIDNSMQYTLTTSNIDLKDIVRIIDSM